VSARAHVCARFGGQGGDFRTLAAAAAWPSIPHTRQHHAPANTTRADPPPPPPTHTPNDAVLLPHGTRARVWEALAAALLTSAVSFLLPLLAPCQPCPRELVGEACPRLDNAHSGNYVNFGCPAGAGQYNDLATLFFNTQVRLRVCVCGCVGADARIVCVGASPRPAALRRHCSAAGDSPGTTTTSSPASHTSTHTHGHTHQHPSAHAFKHTHTHTYAQDDAIRNLFSAQTKAEYSVGSLLTFAAMFFLLAVMSYGEGCAVCCRGVGWVVCLVPPAMACTLCVCFTLHARLRSHAHAHAHSMTLTRSHAP
jgi:hypothetical protein